MQQISTSRERGIQYQNLLNLLDNHRRDSKKSGPPLQATRVRTIVNSHRMAEAYKPGSKVAYVSDQFPTEIVYALGAVPWNIESMAIMLAQSLDCNRIFQLTQEQQLSRDICSFLRGPFGMMLADCYPTPDIVLTNDQPCEGLSKLMSHSGRTYEVPSLALHTPNLIDEDALEYVVGQIEHMMIQTAEVFGDTYDPACIDSAVAHSNEARRYYRDTIELLCKHKLPGVSRELHEIFGMNVFGSKANVQICKTLFRESRAMVGGETAKGRRILWIGQVPEESHELLVHIREVADIVYWAPLWEANRMDLDEENPLRAIAERAILYHWNAEQMETEMERICDDFGVEGFLIANVWGCRNMLGISPMFRDFANRKHIKFLTINIDLVDRNNYAFNQVKNRVDAFLELMQ